MNCGKTISNNDININGSQLEAGSLIQAERNEKAFKRIQKKMTRARSTLDWSQFNNISCFLFDFLVVRKRKCCTGVLVYL